MAELVGKMLALLIRQGTSVHLHLPWGPCRSKAANTPGGSGGRASGGCVFPCSKGLPGPVAAVSFPLSVANSVHRLLPLSQPLCGGRPGPEGLGWRSAEVRPG